MSDIREELDKMFSAINEELTFPLYSRSDWKPMRAGGSAKAWTPPIEFSETEKFYTVKAELPGLKPEDIKVEVLNNVLTLKGERRYEQKTEKENLHRSEFRYESFYRQIPLPSDVLEKEVEAEFHQGILEVKLPKLEETKRQQVQVNVKSK